MPGFRYTPFASLSEEFARRSVTCACPARRSTSRECRWPTSSPPTPASGNGSAVARNQRDGHDQPLRHRGALDGLHGRRRVTRRAQRLPVGKLPFPAGLLRAASSAVPGASAGRDLPRLEPTAGRGAVVRRAHPTAAGRRPPARQLGSMYGTAGEGFIRLNIAVCANCWPRVSTA